jgi:exosortase
VVFAPALAALAREWSAVDYQSHGFLVPIVSLLVAASILRVRPRPAAAPDGRGALLLLGALAGYAFGLGAGSATAQGLALCAAIAGSVWFLRGSAWLRRLAFPIGYLLFMVPIHAPWLSALIVPLLEFVTAGSVAVLHALDVPVLRQGNVIELPGGASLFVAEACSGLTSLVTLTPIAVLIAWLAPLSNLRRILLVVLVVPVAMTANLLRVIGTVYGTMAFGVGAVTDEPVHTLVGLSVYAVGCVVMLALARGLSGPLRGGSAPRAPSAAG